MMADYNTHYRVVLTAIVLLVGIVHAIVGVRLRQGLLTSVLISAGLLVTIWTPQHVRDALLAVCLGLLAVLGATGVVGRVVVGLIAGALVYGIGRVIPGGTFTPILGILAIIGAFAIRHSVVRRRRMSRARALQPNQPIDGQVEFAGRARAIDPVALPGQDREVVAWHATLQGANRTSSSVFEIVGDYGVVLVDPSKAKLDLSQQAISVSDAEAKPIFDALDEPKPTGIDKGMCSASVCWLEQDAEVYVVGRPTWKAHASADGGGYRDAPVAPIFGESAHFADRSEEQLDREARWQIWSWSLWSPVCIMVALYIIFGADLF